MSSIQHDSSFLQRSLLLSPSGPRPLGCPNKPWTLPLAPGSLQDSPRTKNLGQRWRHVTSLASASCHDTDCHRWPRPRVTLWVLKRIKSHKVRSSIAPRESHVGHSPWPPCGESMQERYLTSLNQTSHLSHGAKSVNDNHLACPNLLESEDTAFCGTFLSSNIWAKHT